MVRNAGKSKQKITIDSNQLRVKLKWVKLNQMSKKVHYTILKRFIQQDRVKGDQMSKKVHYTILKRFIQQDSLSLKFLMFFS